MNKKFEIISIPENARENTEDTGTKEKFWFQDSQLGLCLYKKARKNTGEDWAEKITAELCKLLNIPHAEYELAVYQNEKGVVSKSFLPNNARLVLGNEILADQFSDYPQEISNPSNHTLDNIFTAFHKNLSLNLPLNWQPVEGIKTAIDTFIGYLLLDAWIGNSDRHHENWAFINLRGKDYLAPTYDHGSSLGRNESDEKRKARLHTKDKGYTVEAYANKCSSCLYDKVEAKKLKTFNAFVYAAEKYPQSAKIWLNNLEKIFSDNILNLWQCFPDNYISPIAVEFARKILEINQNKLLSLREKL